MQVVQRECQRLQDLLDNFLSYAKVRTLRLEPTNLNDQVDRVFDFFRPKAAEAGIELVYLSRQRLAHRAAWTARRSTARC